VSWWDIDMPGADWLAECRTAVESGYTSFKTKARPWFDLKRQLDVLTPGVPEWFHLDLDFNGLLVDTARAGRLIESIASYRNVAILETPIPQADVAGMKRLRQVTAFPFAMHYGNPSLQVVVENDLCDGFVLGGGASKLMQAGSAIAEAERIFWLQMVGTGITAVWSLQFAAVLSHARWPAVNCHQLYVDQLIQPAITVEDGTAAIPDSPGLGVELDEDAVERYRIDPKEKPYPHPNLLLAIRWPSGGTSYYAHTMQYWRDFEKGRLPLFEPGVFVERVEDDGSAEWRKLAEQAAERGFHVGATPKTGENR
jgi:L-alanine-DL-glutamate epimerase-like enolase superfamily enzyme